MEADELMSAWLEISFEADVVEEEDKTKDMAKDVHMAGEPPVATNTDQQLNHEVKKGSRSND